MPLRGRPRNPFGQEPERFHRLRPLGGDVQATDTKGSSFMERWHELPSTFTSRRGESPGTMETDTRSDTIAPGSIRRIWQQFAAFIPAPPPFPVSLSPAMPQRQQRYKTQNLYLPAGSDNSRFNNLHTVILQKARSQPATLSAGTRRGRPVIRNRISTFGSRVPPLNRRSPSAVSH